MSKEEEDNDKKVNMIVLGDSCVGKTNFILRMMKG